MATKLDDNRYTGRFRVRPAAMGSSYEVHDQLDASHGSRDLSEEEAEQLATELNRDNLLADPPIWYVVIRRRGRGRGRLVNGELYGWERRHGGVWHGLVRTSETGAPSWYPEAVLRDPATGVFQAPRTWPDSTAVRAALRIGASG